MKRPFNASITREGEWFVAQCLEVDVASQGKTEEEALDNLREARGAPLHAAPRDRGSPGQAGGGRDRCRLGRCPLGRRIGAERLHSGLLLVCSWL